MWDWEHLNHTAHHGWRLCHVKLGEPFNSYSTGIDDGLDDLNDDTIWGGDGNWKIKNYCAFDAKYAKPTVTVSLVGDTILFVDWAQQRLSKLDGGLDMLFVDKIWLTSEITLKVYRESC